jgi:hypothetical protein
MSIEHSLRQAFDECSPNDARKIARKWAEIQNNGHRLRADTVIERMEQAPAQFTVYQKWNWMIGQETSDDQFQFD